MNVSVGSSCGASGPAAQRGATVSEFADLQERVFALYAERQFGEIRGLLDKAVEPFPNRPSRITF